MHESDLFRQMNSTTTYLPAHAMPSRYHSIHSLAARRLIVVIYLPSIFYVFETQLVL